MSITAAEPAARADSSPNKNREKEWKAEIHTPEADYNANVPMDAIERDPANRIPGADDIKARAASIDEVGLLQPVVLRALGGGRYQLMAGETRWRAFQLLKRKTIPARIYKNQSDIDAAAKALVENAQRADLKPMERARRFKQLELLGKKQKEIGALAGGLSQPVVANALRLLDLPEVMQKMIDAGELTEAHGVVMAKWAKWPRACARMGEMARVHGHSAKDLAGDGVPFGNQLIQDKLLEKIAIKQRQYYSDQIYKLPRHLYSHTDFVIGEHFAYYFLPADPKENVWAPFKAEQDKEYAAKQVKTEAREASKQSTMSPAAKKDRQKKIASNKAARASIADTLERAKVSLRSADGLSPAMMHVLVDELLQANRYSAHLRDAADVLGIKLPKASGGSSGYWRCFKFEHLHSLKPADLARLGVLAVLLRQSEDAHRFASDVPDASTHIAGKTKLVRQVAPPPAKEKKK